jgi:hypothetical protein
MYYHCRELKYVSYGKLRSVVPVEEEFARAYRWLGHYCGFFPQLWLSRSNSSITGFRSVFQLNNGKILFGFDVIRGFSISLEPWELLLNALFQLPSNLLQRMPNTKEIGVVNQILWEDVQQIVKDTGT